FMQRMKIGKAVARIAGALVVLVALQVGSHFVHGSDDYSHVYSMMIAKVRYLGHRPADPNVLSPDARLLWSGPFESATLSDLIFEYPLGLIILILSTPLALRDWLDRSRWRDPEARVIDAIWIGTVMAVILGQMIQRLFILPGLLTAAWAAVALSRVRQADVRPIAAVGGLVAQALFFAVIMHRHVIEWYQPAGSVAALRQLID